MEYLWRTDGVMMEKHKSFGYARYFCFWLTQHFSFLLHRNLNILTSQKIKLILHNIFLNQRSISEQKLRFNMKKTIITIMLAIVSMATFAQNEPGTLTIYPRVGVNFSKFADSGIGYFDGQSIAYTESKFKPGLVLGVEGEYQLSDLFAISGGVLYSQQGERYDLPSDSKEYDKVKYDNINIPLLAVFKTRIGLSVKCGLQPELVINNPDFKARKVNLSLPLGVAYEYKDLSLDLRYNLGMTNVMDLDGITSKNRTIMLTFGYGIKI